MRSIQQFLAGVQQVAQFDPTIVHAVTARRFEDSARCHLRSGRYRVRREDLRQIVQNLNQKAQQAQTAEVVPKLAKAAAALSKDPSQVAS